METDITTQPLTAAFLLQAGQDPTPSHVYQLYNQEVSVCRTQNIQRKRNAKNSWCTTLWAESYSS